MAFSPPLAALIIMVFTITIVVTNWSQLIHSREVERAYISIGGRCNEENSFCADRC